VSPAINLDDEKRRSVSPMSGPCVGRRVSPPINLLKEKEWDPWNRRSAATVEGVSTDDGTEGVRFRVHMEVHLCDEHRCGMVIWIGQEPKQWTKWSWGWPMCRSHSNQHPSLARKWWVNNSDESPLMGWRCWWQSPWSLGNALGERAIFVWRSGAVATLQTVEQWGHHHSTNLHLT